MPRLPRLASAATAALALGVIAAVPAAGHEPPVTDPHIVAHFDLAAGQTPENIALEGDGSADLTLALARQVTHVALDGTTRVLATLPAERNPDTPLLYSAVVTGIARAHDGTLYVNYATGTAKTGVWRIPGDGGAPVQIAKLPPDGLPNGLALDERRNVLYAADSVRGTVWRVPRSGGTATAWAIGASLRPLPAPPAVGLGANGIKVHRDAVWVSNTDRETLLRLPVRPDGGAGPAETRATGLGGIDDFAFPGRGSTVLAALNRSSQVVLVRRDGTRTVVLTGRDGLSNPTSVAVRGRNVYVPGAALLTRRDPNLLLARLRYPSGRL
jgi:sugar lactone lactonase YvrE